MIINAHDAKHPWIIHARACVQQFSTHSAILKLAIKDQIILAIYCTRPPEARNLQSKRQKSREHAWVKIRLSSLSQHDLNALYSTAGEQ